MARSNADRGCAYYPAFLDLCHKRVVIVGAGEVATGKATGVLPCGAEPLVVIAPAATDVIRAEAGAGALEWIKRPYRAGDVAGAAVAFAATNDRALNAEVAAEARALGIPVLAVDDVPNCDFVAPAVVRRGDLVVAVSTGGRSPALAHRARLWIEEMLPTHWGDLLDVAAAVRTRLGEHGRRVPAESWQSALDTSLEDLVENGHLGEAEERLFTHLVAATEG